MMPEADPRRHVQGEDIPRPSGSHRSLVRKLVSVSRDLKHLLAESSSERAAIEQKLLKLSAVAEQNPASIVITNLDGTIEYVNPKFTDVTGYLPEEVYGRNSRILKSGQNLEEAYVDLWRTISGGAIWNGELHNRKKNGALFWERVLISPILDEDGRAIRYLAIKEDITSQKALEEQYRHAQKMEAVGRLAGGVAHDFNNKLQTIVGNAEMALMRENLDDELREELEEIKKAACYSADLTRQLLAFARKQVAHPRVLDLDEMVPPMLNMLKRLIPRGIQLHWKPEEHLWPIHIDPSQLDQILANLVLNACDAMSASGELTVRAHNVELSRTRLLHGEHMEPGDHVVVEVEDTGCGISEEALEHIFEPFFTTKEIGKGTGLGLATVYGIVSQNRGGVHVRSEIGKGTTFTLFFPRALECAAKNTPHILSSRGPTGTESIILVEDETPILKLATSMLSRHGYNVFPFEDPGKAMRLLVDLTQPIHLLITDIVMPGISGVDLAQKMKHHRPNSCVIYMSGYTRNTLIQQGIETEEISFLQKPFSLECLLEKVRDTLDEGAHVHLGRSEYEN